MDEPKRTLEQVLEAIDGSDGIKAVIARRLGVTRPTVDAYLKRWKTAQQAYEQANDAFLDLAESLVVRNIKLGLEEQEKTREQVNSGDARWVLTMKGAGRGYAPKQRIEQEGTLEIKLTWGDDADADD